MLHKIMNIGQWFFLFQINVKSKLFLKINMGKVKVHKPYGIKAVNCARRGSKIPKFLPRGLCMAPKTIKSSSSQGAHWA